VCLYGELQTQTSEHVSEATETLHCSLKNVDFAGSFGLVVGVCKKLFRNSHMFGLLRRYRNGS
jgi:hypothetical protein